MKKKIALLGALVGAAAMSSSAFAALSNSANVSSRNVKPSAWEEFKEKSSISYFAEYNDADVTNSTNEGAYFQSISGRYKLNDTWTARADLRINTKEGPGDKYGELNPRVGVQGLVYADGNFSIFSMTRLELGMTDGAQDKDRLVKPKFYNAASYSLGAHSLSVGFEIAKWIYDDTANKADNQYSTYADVTYRYTFNDQASFQTYLELPGQARNGQGLFGAERTQADERALIGMDLLATKNLMNIAKNVTIFPHVIVQPEIDESANDLGVGAWISAQFFQ